MRAEAYYEIPKGITLEKIAEAACTTANWLIDDNSSIQGLTPAQYIGCIILVYQRDFDFSSKIKLTQKQLEQRLAALSPEGRVIPPVQSGRSIVKAKAPTTQPDKPLTGTLGKKTDACQVTTQSPCTEEYVDLFHITQSVSKGKNANGEEQVEKIHKLVPLTKKESDEIAEEEQMIKELINEFYQGINALPSDADEETVKLKKKELFQKLAAKTKDIEKYGPLFLGAPTTTNEEGVKVAATGTKVDPTSMLEIRRLNSMESTHNEAEEVEIDEPAKINASSMGKTLNSGITFSYVRSTRVIQILANRGYEVPPVGTNPAWWDRSNRGIKIKELVKEIKNTSVKDFDKKAEAKLSKTWSFLNECAYQWNADDNKRVTDLGLGFKLVSEREAQVLRAASNASASMGYDSETGAIAIGVKAQAVFSLAEGKASTSIQTPPKHVVAKLPAKDGGIIEVNYGVFRTTFTIGVSGFAGASLLMGANVNVGMEGGRVKVKASSEFTHDDGSAARGVNASVEAFVGVKVGCDAAGKSEWQDKLGKDDWQELCSLGVAASASFGGRLGGDFFLGYSDGKFMFRMKGALGFGPGASGEFACTVNVNSIVTMTHFIYNSLLKLDFSQLDWFTPEAFSQWKTIMLALVAQRVALTIEGVYSLYKEVEYYWNNARGNITLWLRGWNEDKAEELAHYIIGDVQLGASSICLHMPPESKGLLLHQLTQFDLFTFDKSSVRRDIAQGIFELLKACQSTEEYNLSFACMNESGTLMTKGPQREATIKANKKKIFGFFETDEKLYNLTPDYLYYSKEVKRIAAKAKELDDIMTKGAPVKPQPDKPVDCNYSFSCKPTANS